MRRPISIFALCASALLFTSHRAVAQDNPFAACRAGDSVRMQGSTPEPITERPGALRYTLTGAPVVITCDDTILQADEIVYEDDTRAIRATGNVLLQQQDLTIYAARATMSGQTKLGTFYQATGMARILGGPTEKSLFGTLEPDVMFSGDEIEKTGPRTYRLRNGRFTTCVQPTPRWEMTQSDATITLDRHALLKNVVLRVKDVPLLYVPAIYYPLNKEDRSTGFLLPTYGNSTIRGSSISNAFFLAISRSQDATFYHDWFTSAGQGYGAEYRYVHSADSRGDVVFYALDEKTGTTLDSTTRSRSYQIDGQANQGLPRGFRLLGRVNYFTDISTQQSYQNIFDFSNRERAVSTTLTGSVGRFRITAIGERRDHFRGTDDGSRYGRLPSVNLSLSERPLGRSRVYVGGSVEGAYFLSQSDVNDPDTDGSLWRFDGGPSVRVPISTLSFLSATASASWRVTRWLETIDDETGLNIPVPLTRQLFQFQTQVTGPVFARIFQTPGSGYADRFKHLIEPTFGFVRTTPFDEHARIVRNDSIDRLAGGTTQVNYGLRNRLLARRPSEDPARPGIAREILSAELSQTYYSDPLAARNDSQYQTSLQGASTSFSPLALNVTARPTDLTSGRFRMEIDPKYRAVRTVTATWTAESPRTQLSGGWSRRFAIPEIDPAGRTSSHFLNADVRLKTTGNRIGGSYDMYFDVKEGSFVQQRIVAYYNSQCCGIAFDWQTIQTRLLGVPSDKRFGVSFTLAGIGSFANPLGSFGGR